MWEPEAMSQEQRPPRGRNFTQANLRIEQRGTSGRQGKVATCPTAAKGRMLSEWYPSLTRFHKSARRSSAMVDFEKQKSLHSRVLA